MTNRITNKQLSEQLDTLPDALVESDLPDRIVRQLIERMDDRYLRQTEAARLYVTRVEAGIVAALLTLFFTGLTTVTAFLTSFKK